MITIIFICFIMGNLTTKRKMGIECPSIDVTLEINKIMYEKQDTNKELDILLSHRYVALRQNPEQAIHSMIYRFVVARYFFIKELAGINLTSDLNKPILEELLNSVCYDKFRYNEHNKGLYDYCLKNNKLSLDVV